MGKKRKTQNQKEKRAKKRRDKEQWEATPILEKAGMVSFKSAGTVGCVIAMIILSEFRTGQYRNHDHRKDEPFFKYPIHLKIDPF